MERVVRVFRSFAEADEADEAYYAALTPQQRLDVLLEIVRRHNESFGEAAERFARVHRIDELARR